MALPKFIISLALFKLGWEVLYQPPYLYNRDDIYVPNKKYQIMHSVSVFKRIPQFGNRLDEPMHSQYSQKATEIINSGIISVDELVKDPEIRAKIESDLGTIVEFRDSSQKRVSKL